VSNKAIRPTVGSAISQGAQQLQEIGVAEPRREAGSLLAHLLGCDRTFVIAHADTVITVERQAAFQSLLKRRASGEPLQYITGHQEFFKLDFEVTPDVLIPRPETELIVETALELLQKAPAPYFADVGTGSGCIAISLLHELPSARAVALDMSTAALAVARRNSRRHNVENRIELVESDLFSVLESDKLFELILSNPPYVSRDEMKTIQRDVRAEPRTALEAGSDGLTVIRRLLREARPFLYPRGYFVFEIGFGQHDAVSLLIDRSVWKLIEIRKDLRGIPRIFVLQGR
jgi:release factor glutamine methyltransferase